VMPFRCKAYRGWLGFWIAVATLSVLRPLFAAYAVRCSRDSRRAHVARTLNERTLRSKPLLLASNYHLRIEFPCPLFRGAIRTYSAALITFVLGASFLALECGSSSA